MRKLLNVLYVTTEDAYAYLDGENVVLSKKEAVLGRFPLHILEGIYLFTYAGASPQLIAKCCDNDIDLVQCTPAGRFLARPCGRTRGNVLLRREQYRIADDPIRSCEISRNMVYGKIVNEKHVLDRMARDHPDRVPTGQLSEASHELKKAAEQALTITQKDTLRGLEGSAANIYFDHFDDLILKDKENFNFQVRTRRPPLDRINALLSYVYMMLTSMCASALESVGLDPYVGFMHTDRSGRVSLALDLIEEFRPCLADRFVLSLVNNGVINAKDFDIQANGAVLIREDGRNALQQAWQKRKAEKIMHPYLKESIEWGLLPYVQAMLLARMIRKDIDGYPPFIWR